MCGLRVMDSKLTMLLCRIQHPHKTQIDDVVDGDVADGVVVPFR